MSPAGTRCHRIVIFPTEVCLFTFSKNRGIFCCKKVMLPTENSKFTPLCVLQFILFLYSRASRNPGFGSKLVNGSKSAELFQRQYITMPKQLKLIYCSSRITFLKWRFVFQFQKENLVFVIIEN